MLLSIYVLIAIVLIFLNAFFVLAEFAAVKMRPTQVEALAEAGNGRARIVERIQAHLDEFLSVCQVGITLASIGLGFVGEPAFAKLILPAVQWVGITGVATRITAHSVAIAIAYLLVSFLHIVLGELVPKSVAIRSTEKSALLTAWPMVIFRYIFIAPIWLLNATVNGILRVFRLPPVTGHGAHSEEEIRIILDQSQSSGMLSFRRLLHMENVLDMGTLTVRNAMRARRLVRCLSTTAPRLENEKIIAEYRYSRYPVLGEDPEKPLGYVHIKDLFLADRAGKQASDLKSFVRPCLQFKEQDPLEQRLSEMQRRAAHMALVFAEEGKWTGIITLEDAVEEVIGTIEEEYPNEPTIRLADLLMPEHTLLDVEGASILAATRNALLRISVSDLPVSRDAIMLSVADRERLGSSYVGRRLAIPHARLSRLSRPMVIVARMKTPIPAPVANEDINLLFILLTPADTPRIHQILLSHIAGIFESDFLEGRLEDAATAAELHNVICTAEQVVLA
ncbi:MAG: CNNM domain-containing protein [Spirochaetia bacterium]|jgi:CBS domain containing-hemolysin-like protein/mannitol/fructose-specific phosphotransferase system IIA component